jgi:hypothetical protein
MARGAKEGRRLRPLTNCRPLAELLWSAQNSASGRAGDDRDHERQSGSSTPRVVEGNK